MTILSPFPDSKRVVFGRNPLEVVVAQVQFPPILAIEAQTPAEFQERIRAEFPQYVRETLLPMPAEITAAIARQGMPPNPQVSHTFRSADGQRAIALTSVAISYEDRTYRQWESFKGLLSAALTALSEVYRPDLSTRTGLRYINGLRQARLGVAGGLPWARLLRPEIAGVLTAEALAGVRLEVRSVAMIELGGAPRSFVQVQYGAREATDETPPSKDTIFVIDSDFYTYERSDVLNALGLMDEFNRESGRLFRWAITPELYDALEPSDALVAGNVVTSND